eukprot:scaffold683_cov423-Prasinococcus_capsulatus_cf.AAC.5
MPKVSDGNVATPGLRFFDISQFHIITSEDLHASSDMDIIDRVSKHLQLNATSGGELLPHVAEYCTQPKRKQYCKPRKKPLNSQTHTSEESRTADGFSLDVIKVCMRAVGASVPRAEPLVRWGMCSTTDSSSSHSMLNWKGSSLALQRSGTS